MISPRLQLLQRQMARSTAKDPEEKGELDSRAMVGMAETFQKEFDKLIVATDALVKEAQAECAQLRSQMADMQAAHKQECDAMQCEMNDKESAAEEKMDGMCADHGKEMKQMQGQVESLQKELAAERQARTRAETECQTSRKMCDNLEKIIDKLRATPAAAPSVVMPPKGPMPAFETRVTQRDANGHVMAFVTKPTT